MASISSSSKRTPAYTVLEGYRLHARTLEIFDQIGLAKEAVVRGTVAGAARLVIDGEIRGDLRFADVGKGMSPFPFVLMLEQSKTERLLYEYLQSHHKDVQWETELESFSQAADGIVARVKSAGDEVQTISAKYLVGCDGPKSLVRLRSDYRLRAALSSESSMWPTRKSIGE